MEKSQRINKGLKDFINETAKSKQFHIPTQEEKPKGLHQRFYIQKISGARYAGDNMLGEAKYEPVLKPVDTNAEYFVLRLDTGGKDINHIKACRIGIHAYADAIEATIPELAKDLRERYPLIQ